MMKKFLGKGYLAKQKKIDFLKREKSWCEDILQYGKIDETCIEFLHEQGVLIEISYSLDLRSAERQIIEKLVEYAKKMMRYLLLKTKCILQQ